MIYSKRVTVSILNVLVLTTICLSTRPASAEGARLIDHTIWCEDTKGGSAKANDNGKTGTVSCFVNGKSIHKAIKYVVATGKLEPEHCLCDSNGNGERDAGDELKDEDGNKVADIILSFLTLSNPAPPIDPVVLSSLVQASQDLFAGVEFSSWIALTLNQTGNLEIAVDLRNVPTLDLDPTFAREGFTEMNLVYQEARGSLSGINLSTLVQSEKTFLEFDPTIFEPFGEFSASQLGVTVYNPSTEQQVQVFEDNDPNATVPEPSTILGLLTFASLGVKKIFST